MYQWAVFLHILIAMFWIGGMLFTVAVLVPATRRRLASQKGLLFIWFGRYSSDASNVQNGMLRDCPLKSHTKPSTHTEDRHGNEQA